MARGGRTRFMQRGLEDAVGFIEKRYGRHGIHRDSPVDRGVYLGAGEREAIVVDSEKYPAIRVLYEKAKEKALVGKVDISVAKRLILNAVYETVKEAMKHDEKAVDELVESGACENHGKISPGMFINRNIRKCRHMALACGALLELFKKDGYIRGNISVDRNTDKAGHAWCRYTNSGGDVFILDVAQGYIGRLENAANRDYRRPEQGQKDN